MNKKLGLFFCLAFFLASVALMAQDNANVHYIYDDVGQLIGSVDANGNAKAYTYDASGNLTAVEHLLPRGDIDIFFVNPNHGSPGTRVSIFGMGFSEALSDNQIIFSNGVSALVEAVTASSITVLVPDGATTGPVRVTSPLGTAVSRSDFTVDAPCVNPSGLVSWWPGEEDASDIIGNNNGRMMDGAFARGKVGRAFSFSGFNQFVDIPAINIPGRTFSLDFWMFPTRAADFQHLVSNSRDNPAHNFGELDLRGDVLRYELDSAFSCCLETPAGSIPLNTWSHVALTYDGIVTRLYINGVVRATSVAHDEFFNNPLRLGYSVQGDRNFFGGLLDEVSLYNRALSDGEVQAIFNTGSLGKCRPGG